MIELADKLYTSQEVAKILNVTLRTLYRYLERGYLTPDIQLMSGRYRFSRQNLESFLSKRKELRSSEPAETNKDAPQIAEGHSEPKEEAPIWALPETSPSEFQYFKSPFDSLKTIAKIINQTAAARNLPYAFTMGGGLSLYREAEPFSIVYAYVTDVGPFIAALQAEKVSRDDASVCLIKTKDEEIFRTAEEKYGFKVASLDRIERDLANMGPVQ